MTDYKMLAVYYLKYNKRRSIVTILGVTITVMVLFVLLNYGEDYFLDARQAARAQADYDLVLYTETESQIQEISAREEVVSAYRGDAYDEGNEVLYENALYISIKNPYKMSATLSNLCSEYEIDGEVNDEIAMYYFDDIDNMVFIIVMLVILVSYIFAIFGVGIIRNSIQLFSLEQIKDYGILRCVGATKRQLKTFIYLMGAILECIGVVVGVVLGYPVCLIIGAFFHNFVAFHLLPVLMILVVFLFDLFFVMQESSKFVNNMTPVSAVRGEFRIKKEKIKVRGKGIMGHLLGAEGEYAYKSLMRNSGRFWKSVFTIGIGIAAVISVMSVSGTIQQQLEKRQEVYGWYQMAVYENISPFNEPEEVASNIPTVSEFQSLTDLEEVTAAKRMYLSQLLATSPEETVGRLSKEYAEKTVNGVYYTGVYDSYVNGTKDYYSPFLSTVSVNGYDEEEYGALESSLSAGTLDISENGVILVGSSAAVNYTEDETLADNVTYGNYTVSDYQVGDTIDLLDMEKYRELVTERLVAYDAENEEEGKDYDTDEALKIRSECMQELEAAGEYKTYTIEGIVERDTLGYGYDTIELIVPLEKYFTMTGLTEDNISGMKFHIKGTEVSSKSISVMENIYWNFYSGNGYVMLLVEYSYMKKNIRVIAFIVIFVVTISAVNIINTAASNIHLRKKEFAQLRVIGMSKKRLIYTVLLEGVATTIGANVVGIVVGLAISYYLYKLFSIIFAADFVVPWLGILIGFVGSALLFCGSVYAPLKGLSMNMAQDLTTDGD